MKKTLLLFFVLINSICSAQNIVYIKALDTLQQLIVSNEPKSFKKAVFTSENAFLNDTLNNNDLDNTYNLLSRLALIWTKHNYIPGYNVSDSNQMLLNRAIFQVIKDTVTIVNDTASFTFLPFEYNFDDYDGKKDWTNTFVSKLLGTHKGNCHSLPYLYKIIADEIGAKCWLALAPNHMYIKNRSVRDGWFNTELTSGNFPIDAWITASGYIPLQAIQSGIYCDTLSNQQSIALCVLDLAKCYEKQTKNYYDGFILKCCDLVLKYHAVNVQALLLKAETLKRIYEQQQKEDNGAAENTYTEMEQLYLHIYDLGYREMPDKMYKEWLASLKELKGKYTNSKVK